jgi:inward rectifier potassium channel
MHPQTVYAHFVNTLELFLGMAFIAVMTGLIFTRFSRPQARLIFAQHPVIGPHDGKTHLMFRVANARTNNLTDARAKLWLVRNEQSLEGSNYRRFYRLPLRHDENPVFSLSWLLLHHIDENSMLYGLNKEDLQKSDASFVISIAAIDESSAQQIHVRHSVTHDELRWGHMFVDIIDSTQSPKLYIDYNKLDDVRPFKA